MVRRGRDVLFIVCGVLLLFGPLLWIAKGGTDFDKYLHWGLAFKYGDITQLRSATLSPVGLPFSQWSFGPGLIFSLGLLFDIWGPIYVGWIFTVVFWVTYTGILRIVTRDQPILVLLGVLMTFLGTSIGYYSWNYSSESLSYACLSVPVYLALRGRTRWFDLVVTGVCLALLVALRPQLGLYCLPVLLLNWYGSSEAELRNKTLVFSLVPITLAIGATAVVNFWMTGSALASPYSFSHGKFSSMDWLEPEFMAVLLHPYHGLVSCHPLYLVGFVALLSLVALCEDKGRQKVLAVTVLAVSAHLYIHAAWFWWWLAEAFGMRGMSLTGIILVPALSALLARKRQASASYYLWLAAALGCTVWSFALLLNPTQACLTYPELLAVASQGIRGLLRNWWWVAMLCAWFYAVSVTIPDAGRVERSMFAVLSSLLAYYLLLTLSGTRFSDYLWIAWLAAAIALLPWMVRSSGASFATRLVGAGMCVVFAYCCYSFSVTAMRTFKVISTKAIDPRGYVYTGVVDVDLIDNCLRQYQAIPGFDEKRSRLAELRRHLNTCNNPLYQGAQH